MAGIEKVEIHSRSYIVRWIKVDGGRTLSWSLQPYKKSINFGVVRHPGSGASTLSSASGELEPTQPLGNADVKPSRPSRGESTAQDLLTAKGFLPLHWYGRCEADKVSTGSHDVQHAQGGMYGLVFDNTFSKQTSKTATFVVFTYPIGTLPPASQSISKLQQLHAQPSQLSVNVHGSPRNELAPSISVDSFHSRVSRARATSSLSKSDFAGAYPCHVGALSKRRRKKGQGYARRFFSLDYSTYTLSYYHNRNSSALRGAIPLSLAAIAADERRREISIDSGAEIWHLRAPNDKEFQDWARALERASRLARGLEASHQGSDANPALLQSVAGPTVDNQVARGIEWQQVEALVSRVVGTRDALRRLTKDTASTPKPGPRGQNHSIRSSSSRDEPSDGYFPAPPERKPFWKRKSSASILSLSTHQQQQVATPPLPPVMARGGAKGHRSGRVPEEEEEEEEEMSMHAHCEALLSDLDSVVAEFTTLIANGKRRRMLNPMGVDDAYRKSFETNSTADEFYDAEDEQPALVKIDASGEESAQSDQEADDAQDSSSISTVDEAKLARSDGVSQLFPPRPRSLTPLPMHQSIARRRTIPPAAVQPPSLIAFVRKNVGKDLSTISMPVSANEPTSLLQKVAEQLEYAQLLDQAARQKSATERLLLVSAFAVSQFSGGRAKERAVRKPFNPLLGETFELIRTNEEVPGGFRLLVEKVSHRPVRLALQADAAQWSLSQSPAPGQKFWGKSAEITTEGRVRVALRLQDGADDELYSWNVATMFLRNVVMGEKYVEPVGTMHVVNDSTGHKACVQFKSKGMFGGRSEEVQVSTQAPDGKDTGSGLVGTWTGGLRTTGPGKAASEEEVWRVGELVAEAARTYGMPLFAASLNEVTEVERGKLAPTDSRLRPDQRLAEQGRLDEAEGWKHRLEEAQRARRRAAEERGETHRPRWFVQADGCPDGEEVWTMRVGKDGYWEERARGSWRGVPAIFDAPADG